MNCDWASLMSLLPTRLRTQVDKLGRESLEELRLRLGQAPELVMSGGSRWLEWEIGPEDLSFVVNGASRYSPWASESISRGFLTAPGGHRIGICGDVAMQDRRVHNIRQVSSLCIRVARDFPGISEDLPLRGSVLILGSPGYGKTTLLRDLIRSRSEGGAAVSVVDERGELFPPGFHRGARTDVLTGCPKPEGIEMVLRTMGPGTVAVDEITAQQDCEALLQAAWCGVTVLATAHAASVQDLVNRPLYNPLVRSGIFREAIVMNRDKSWRRERIYL
jgi:stage III sporulation protein AA